jgi:hypothetical protein
MLLRAGKQVRPIGFSGVSGSSGLPGNLLDVAIQWIIVLFGMTAVSLMILAMRCHYANQRERDRVSAELADEVSE